MKELAWAITEMVLAVALVAVVLGALFL